MNLPQNVVCNLDFQTELKKVLEGFNGKVFVLVDENTEKFCLNKLTLLAEYKTNVIKIKSGEEHKNLNTLSQIWSQMSECGGDRKSLFINLGGGVIGDMGGLAASLFKRGIRFINIPTTLLAQVDASCGGKLAVDFNGLKNEIGLFRNPDKVIISTEFLKTLDVEQLKSGMAEMLKHALLYNEKYFFELKEFNPLKPDYALLSSLVETSVKIKNEFVSSDPTEKGLRKMLNLGHTIGHAIESYSFETSSPLLHGQAVAAGLVCELYLSNNYLDFPHTKLMEIVRYINELYKPFLFKFDTYEYLYSLMTHDKKNSDGQINFSLVSDFGKYKFDCKCKKDDIFQALSFYNQINL
ncbi:MAG: 3-dehydroquinate synthase [Bacteroidales bacterium]|nr:3-dehydroquinate synthase [Bacteroidales bacterium]